MAGSVRKALADRFHLVPDVRCEGIRNTKDRNPTARWYATFPAHGVQAGAGCITDLVIFNEIGTAIEQGVEGDVVQHIEWNNDQITSSHSFGERLIEQVTQLLQHSIDAVE